MVAAARHVKITSITMEKIAIHVRNVMEERCWTGTHHLCAKHAYQVHGLIRGPHSAPSALLAKLTVSKVRAYHKFVVIVWKESILIPKDSLYAPPALQASTTPLKGNQLARLVIQESTTPMKASLQKQPALHAQKENTKTWQDNLRASSALLANIPL